MALNTPEKKRADSSSLKDLYHSMAGSADMGQRVLYHSGFHRSGQVVKK